MTEPARHELYSRLEAVLGPQPAETLMSHLPPTGWADVATVHTQQQLADQLRAEMSELRVEMSGLRVEMSGLRVELHDGLRRQGFALLAGVATVNGLIAAAAGLF